MAVSTNRPLRVRPARAAGLAYPEDPDELATAVDALLAAGAGGLAASDGATPPKALIVPHAAYADSGLVAAQAYARLRPHQSRYRRVVVLGPDHLGLVEGMAVPTWDAFRTPLGPVVVDAPALEDVRLAPSVRVDDEPHDRERAIEVQLPFIQRALAPCSLVPVVVGRTSLGELAAILARLWGDEATLVVVSTDLSNGLGQADAAEADGRTATAIVERHRDIAQDQACGAHALRGLLALARLHELEVEEVARQTSADTGGPTDRVVGYGAFVLRPGPLAPTDGATT